MHKYIAAIIMDAMDNIHDLTISSALELLQGKKISQQDLAEACFRKIERLNLQLNAFITFIESQDALNAQRPPDNNRSSNALRGIPIALKDLFDTAGIRTT